MPKINTLLSEKKVFRDPIHSYVNVEYQIIWDLINTNEFQRLRRIHQLGGTLQVFQTAEHSRFSHSLGTYEVARKFVTNVQSINEYLSEEEKIIVLCAALLHDVGHGPFSHAFEMIHPIRHEEYSIAVILEDTEVNKVLKKYGDDLPTQVANVIAKKHPKVLLNQIVYKFLLKSPKYPEPV